MLLKNEPLENRQVLLTIRVDKEDWQRALQELYNDCSSLYPVEGCAPGKATREQLEAAYGKDFLYQDAVNHTFPEALVEAVAEANLQVAAAPDLSIVDIGPGGYIFTALVQLYPEVKFGQYKGLSAPMDPAELTERDGDEAVARWQQEHLHEEHPERAAMGDEVVLDFEGFDNGVPFEGGKAENHALELGSHSFVPGFEEGVVGLKPGDEKDIDVTFPEDYHADLAGKPVVFKIKVHEVKEPQAPVVDDEFAKDVSEFDTLDEFKKDLGDKLKERRQTQADRAYEDALMDQVVEALEVELPDAMVDYRAEQMVQDYAQRITSQGIPFEKYLEMTGQTMDRMKEQAKESAIKQIKYEMAMDAVAAAEGIVISDEELDAEYQSLADQYKMELDQGKALASAEDVRTTLLRRKAIDVVKDSAKVGKAKKPAAKKAAKETEDETAEEKPKKKAASKKRAETEQAPKTEE